MSINDENMKKVLLKVYEEGTTRLREREQIIQYYSFYKGKPDSEEEETNPLYRGQSWKTPTDLDFTPSKDIRNHAKKLILKQGRFMFGEEPQIVFSPFEKEQKGNAEDKRTFIDTVLNEMDFWGETYKAFIDSTIGKRVLMAIIANPNEPVAVRYFRSDMFSYKCDPLDYKKLKEVIIAYQDESTIGANPESQVWNKYKYLMEGETCKLETSTLDGNGEDIDPIKTTDTTFKDIPCRIILNGGLLGDGLGTSDIEDLMDTADAYNRTYSDFRDALRFKMFEQPVFINASEESVDSAKIAPNSLIDLKGDPAFPDQTPDAKMLGASFSFQDAAKLFLEGTKADMYEIMDQPRPEDVKQVPSGKAFKFTFYDLMARCKEKWKVWMPACKWAVEFILEATELLNLYPETAGREGLKTEGTLVIVPRYPIPEDEADTKGIAMKEVEAQVRSRKSYIRQFSDSEDEQMEFDEIMEETKEIAESTKPEIDPLDPDSPGNLPGGGKGDDDGEGIKPKEIDENGKPVEKKKKVKVGDKGKKPGAFGGK